MVTLRGVYSKGNPLGALGITCSSGLSHYANAHCIHAFFALLLLKLHFVVFADLVNQARRVNKYIFRSIRATNETKTFCFVEEFYDAFHVFYCLN